MATSDADRYAAAKLLEVLLRDARHAPVIVALDRLVLLPVTEAELKDSIRDLQVVRQFFETHLPPDIREVAALRFQEHGRKITEHYQQTTRK